MSKLQFKVLVALGVLIVLLLLSIILPPVGWAVIVLIAVVYGACWVIERALRKAWRR